MNSPLTRTKKHLAAVALAVGLATATASAFSINVTNFSFEDPVISGGQGIIVIPPGWTSFSTAGGGNFDVGVQRPSGTSGEYSVFDPLAAPAQGNNFLWINRFDGNGTQIGGIYQNVGSLLPNTEYTLTVAIGSRADRINSPGILSLVNGIDNTGTLLATTSGIPATQNTWQDYTLNFTTGASVSGDLTILLSVLDAGTIQANFDNVRLDAVAVPEPELYGVALAGLIAVIVWRRRGSRVAHRA